MAKAKAIKDNKSLVDAVLTVNGEAPDANGNVEVEAKAPTDVVKSVNGNTPNASGAVTVDTGVMTINDAEPDESGNIDISTAEPRVTYSSTPPYDIQMQPNTLYYLGETAVQLLNITFAANPDSNRVAEYHLIFKSGSTPTNLNLPNTVKKPTDFEVEANKMYEISICENLMLVTAWEVL